LAVIIEIAFKVVYICSLDKDINRDTVASNLFEIEWTPHLLQRICVIGFMGSWFWIWDDLLRLFAIARVADPNNGLNLVPNQPITETLCDTLTERN
jgi:hypothetical protein